MWLAFAMATGASWESVGRPVSCGDLTAHLWSERRNVVDTEDDSDKWSARKLKKGDMFDCLDTAKKWCIGIVDEIKPDGIYVRYKGWAARWNETIPFDSARLAKLGSHNSKEGPKRAKQGEDWDIEEKVCRLSIVSIAHTFVQPHPF